MTDSASPTDYFERLMRIAKQSRVKVKFLTSDLFPGLVWDGLYLVTRELGAGLALRSDLDPDWRDWVLAHELGHHFGQLNGILFSPFRAHMVDSSSRMRWSNAKRLDPDEENANAWAVKTLVTDPSWDAAERLSPTDLRQIVGRLRLPFPAAVAWERWHRRYVHSDSITVRLTSDAEQILDRPITGQGGHQSFFSRVKPKGGTLAITYGDFSFARERAALVEGGWLTRYEAVLNAIAPMVEAAGTTRALFNLRHATPS
jgi:hypothetical protein